MDSNELKSRTKQFALRIIKVAEALSNTPTGKTIAYQIIRSGTSVASNYRAACRARSKAEFIAKIGTVIEEADETAFWLEIIVEAGLLKEESVTSLAEEANEILSIMVTTSKSAKKK